CSRWGEDDDNEYYYTNW
nr:immunoglobulin heavy chain junction region [Macaca mulatta]MOW75344.1 immunoglobulin heavy chain junction region [Macaca mulatta]MOW77720.1 immunoglobulin heavy chain junction region [Macaca mulatta]MOW78581.1 immunoglobulin heavy chain junction region [Macaca mulatta]MOW82157.1 immunoglobulin heavy chain junction region [Macaca mulatta]